MKKNDLIRKMTALLCGVATMLPLCAGELLENTDFSKGTSTGVSNWYGINGTWTSVSGDVLTIEKSGGNAVVLQKFRPAPGKPVSFSVEVKCKVPGKVRAYIEYEFTADGKKQVKGSGGAWREIKAEEWVTLEGKNAALPEGYAKCYLAIWNGTAEPMEIRKPHADYTEEKAAADIE